MDYQLAKGVKLHIIPSSQFRLTNIVINFSAMQTTNNATARHLLANVLETSCQKYPTQTLLARRLDALFGAVVSANVARVGQIHTLRMRAQVVNDRQAQTALLMPLINLLRELVFRPLMNEKGFDATTVAVQKKSLAGSLAAINDDKQFVAYQRLAQLFYDQTSPMYYPSYGTSSDLDSLNGGSLVSTYRSLRDEDQVDIFVLGEVNTKKVRQAFAKWPFRDRQPLAAIADYHQSFHHRLRQQLDSDDIEQAKLDLAYHLPVYYRDPGYYPGLVMNGLLGGTPYSKLFLNVREKESLAYYADSQLRAFSGHVVIETGISANNYQRVRSLIEQQIRQLQAGQFTSEQLEEVKQSLITSYRVGLDNPLNIIEHRLVNELSGHPELFNVPEAVGLVTKQEVVAVAKQLKLQAVYYLGGDVDE